MKFSPRNLPLLLALVFFAGCETVPEVNHAIDQDSTKTARIHAILERSIAVQGGRERLQKMTLWETQSIMEVPGSKARFPIHIWQQVTGEYRYEIVAPGRGALVEAFDGKTGWRENEQLGFGLIPSGELVSTRRNVAAHIALNVEKMHPTRRLLPPVDLAGRTCDVVELTGLDGVAEKWFFENVTGHLVREERPGQPGHPQGVALEYEDFRPVNGCAIAFVTHRTEGSASQTFRFQSVVINPAVPPGLFSPPEKHLQDNQKIEDILQRHLAAAGGVVAIEQIRSRVSHTTIEATTAGIKSHLVMSVKVPNRILNEQDLPGIGRMVQGFDGQTAWANSDMQGYRVLKGPERQQLVSSADLHAEAGLAGRYPLRKLLPEKTIDGRRTYVVVLSNLQGSAGLHYFDAENYRLLRVETSFATGAKGVMKATVDFSDFRTIDGVVMAFRTVIINPAMRIIVTTDSVQNNVELDDAIFRPRKEE